MLFQHRILEEVVAGRVTLAFRRWKRPSVRAGGTLRTPLGVLAIGDVRRVDEKGITDAEARAAGFDSRAALLRELAQRSEGGVYRIEVSHAGEDPRIALREADVLSDEELAGVRQRLQRLDRVSRNGPWTERVLRLIADQPAVRAGDLAAAAGMDKESFKLNVRKLKNLGLTQSLGTGYQLSPRGAAVLGALRVRVPPSPG